MSLPRVLNVWHYQARRHYTGPSGATHVASGHEVCGHSVACGCNVYGEERIPMSALMTVSSLFLACTVVLCGGIIASYLLCAPYGVSRVDEIRRLRQEGLAVNQAGEA